MTSEITRPSGFSDMREKSASPALRATVFPKTKPDGALFHQFMQVIARVVDDYGTDVSDYFLEFFKSKDSAEGRMIVHDRAEPKDRYWLRRNMTHFAKIIIPRDPIDKVFRLTIAK